MYRCYWIQFRKMLSRELNQFSETSKCGNEISEYICTTFLGKLQKTSIWHYDCHVVVRTFTINRCSMKRQMKLCCRQISLRVGTNYPCSGSFWTPCLRAVFTGILYIGSFWPPVNTGRVNSPCTERRVHGPCWQKALHDNTFCQHPWPRVSLWTPINKGPSWWRVNRGSVCPLFCSSHSLGECD